MPHSRFYSICIIIALSLSSLTLAQDRPNRQTADTSDIAAIIEVINKYYAAYWEKDLSALVRLWSERSPDLSASIEEAQKTLAAESYIFSKLDISQVRLSGNKAILQVATDASITNAETKASRRERITRNFAMIKENGEWKVWRSAAASEDLSAFLEEGSEWKAIRDSADQLANAIVSAKTDEERSRLIAENKKLITTELRDALIKRIDILQFRGNYQQVIILYRIVQSIAEQLGDKNGIGMAQRGIAYALRLLGQTAQALQHYQNALAQFEASGNRAEKAKTLSEIALIYFTQSQYSIAIQNYEKALAEYEALKNNAAIANTLEEIASVHNAQEHYDLALEYLQKCLKLREARGNKAEIAATLSSVGNVYYQQEDYDSAILYYEKALGEFEAANSDKTNLADHSLAIAAVTGNIAAAHQQQGNYDLALDHYYKALKIEQRLGSKHRMAETLLSIAKVYSAFGNYSLALESLQKGLSHFTALRNKSETARAQAEIGEVYFYLHNYSAALEHYQKSLAAYLEMNSDADAGTTLAAIGNAHYLMSSYDQALDSFQKAITHFEAIRHAPGIASLIGSVASTYFSQGKNDLALEFYQKSLSQFEALKDKPRIAATLERIANVHYWQGDFTKSLEFADRAITLAQEIKSQDTLWRAKLVEGLTHRALNEIDKARQSLEQSIAVIEAMHGQLIRGERAQRFFQAKSPVFLAMVELLIAQDKVIEAFTLAERIKTNMLWDVLQSGGVRITKTLTAQQQGEERKLEKEIVSLKARIGREKEKKQPDAKRLSSLDAQLQKALADYRAYELRLYALRPRLKALRSESAPLKIEEAGRLLPDAGTALLEFVATDSRTYLFALTRETDSQKSRQTESQAASAQRRTSTPRPQAERYFLKAYALNVSRNELIERVTKFCEMIAARDEKAGQAARELYDLLLKPAEEQLRAKAAWVVVPDSILWQLPFQALQSADNHYLLEDHAVSYAPSLTALAEVMKQSARSRTGRAVSPMLLAVAGPLVSKQTIERVKLVSKEAKLEASPRTENEAKAIEQLYGAAQSRIYTGSQASEEVVKEQAGKFRVIHFAAPASLNDASPMYSHVALSNAEENGPEDGLLEAWEMAKQNLSADLAVFSTSETAQGRAVTGEAMIGLSWALLVAGCPSAVLSQWNTDAPGATELMLEFHRNIKPDTRAAAGQRARQNIKFAAPAQALRQAMLKLLRSSEYQHPFYWAGFRLIGNWQ